MCTLKPALDALLQVRLQFSPGYSAPIPHLLLAWELHSRFPLPSLSVEGSGGINVHVIPQKMYGLGRKQRQMGQHQRLEIAVSSCQRCWEQNLRRLWYFCTINPHWLLLTNSYFYSEHLPLSCFTVSFTGSILLSLLPISPCNILPFSIARLLLPIHCEIQATSKPVPNCPLSLGMHSTHACFLPSTNPSTWSRLHGTASVPSSPSSTSSSAFPWRELNWFNINNSVKPLQNPMCPWFKSGSTETSQEWLQIKSKKRTYVRGVFCHIYSCKWLKPKWRTSNLHLHLFYCVSPCPTLH